jgi:hypothetical protein
MSMLQSFTVKPNGIYPMTIKAMDANHLDQILSEMFGEGCWKVLADDAQVEITPSMGNAVARPVKDFRLDAASASASC